MNYEITHVSRYDGSPAMEIPQTDYPYSIVLVNEDGHQWTDPLGWWIPVDEVTDDDREYWATVTERDDADYDYTSYDYPAYDAQTAFYESTGRMQFPNEY